MGRLLRYTLIISSIFILIGVLSVDLLSERITNGSLSIASKLPGISIEINNQTNLKLLVDELGFSKDNSYFHWEDRTIHSFKSIEIIFVKDIQPQRQVVNSKDEVVESFSQELKNGKLILSIYIHPQTYSFNQERKANIAAAAIIRTLYLSSPAKKNYFESKELQQELDTFIAKYTKDRPLNLTISKAWQNYISHYVSKIQFIKVVEASCSGSYFCGQNVTVRKCSQAGYDSQCTDCIGKCGLNTDGIPGVDGVCSCVVKCNPNQGYESSCAGLAQNQCPGNVTGCDCVTNLCRWQNPPPPSCSYSACGGYNPTTGRNCLPSERYGNASCPSGARCYDSPSCPHPTPTSVPSTPTPTQTPECSAGQTRCSPRCQSCGSNGRWYDNASNGCFGGDWGKCECLNSGNCTQTTPTPTPVTGSCDSSCGFCGWRASDGACRTGALPNGQFCCHRTCVAGTCANVEGPPGTPNTCSPEGSSCAPPATPPPGSCTQGASCTCSGSTAGACDQCGGKWCNGGKCECNTSGGGEPSCTSVPPLNCSRFIATTTSGKTVQGIDTISANNGVDVPVIEVLPEEDVTFSSNILSGGCGIEDTNFIWEDNSMCTEQFKPAQTSQPATDALWCNTTIQANASGAGDGGVQGIQCNTDMRDDNCRCKEDGVFKRCKDVVNRATTRKFTNPGDYVIKNIQRDAGNRYESANNPCLIKVRISCPDLASPSTITLQNGSTNITVPQSAAGFITDATTHTISWPAITGANMYSIRINEYNPGQNHFDSWDNSCANTIENGNDTCVDTNTTSTTYTFKANKQYRIWVHTRNSCGGFSKNPAEAFIHYAPKGNLQVASCTNLTGWACDLDNTTQAIQVQLYADGPKGVGTLVPGTFTANATDAPQSAAITAACGNAARAFNITLPDSLKDGGSHAIYAYGVNIGTLTEDKLLTGSPQSINKCANKWIKLTNSSFVSTKTNPIENQIPRFVDKFSLNDTTDTTKPVFINGAASAGSVLRLTIGNFAGTSFSDPHNWHSPTYDFSTTTTFNREQYLNYIKARKSYKNITNVNTEITEDGIYLFNESTNAVNYAGDTTKKIVLIVPGTGGINIIGNAQGVFNDNNASITIIAQKINFDSNVKEANGIFIADTINTGINTSQGLKINGNIIATSSLVFEREWSPDQNTQPSLYVVNNPKMYLDLLPYLSTSIYESQQLQ